MTSDQPYSAPPPGGIAGARDFVTGEAVALELRLARLPSRALALAVDLLLLAVPLAAVFLLVTVTSRGTDESLSSALGLVSIVGVVLGYPILFETLSRGRSPGKALLGLRVVRDDGGPIRFRHAFVRALAGVFLDFNPLALGAPALVVSLCSKKGKRIGDLLAGTVVIRERVPRSTHAATPMPPHLAGWATGLQVGLLPDPLAMEARQLLSRLGQLDPAIGHQLAVRLAGEVAAALGQSPPPGMDPGTFLATVLAERRNRELARAVPPQGWGPQPQARGWATQAQGWPARPQQAAPAPPPQAPAAPPQAPAAPPPPAPPAPQPPPPPPGPFTAPS